LRVALVSSGLIPVPPVRGGAVEEYVYQLSRHLRRFGVDAVVIDANYDELIYEELNEAQIVKVPTAKLSIGFKERITKEFLFGRVASRYISREGGRFIFAGSYGLFVTSEYLNNFNGIWILCKNALHMPEAYLSELPLYLAKMYINTSVIYLSNNIQVLNLLRDVK
jgi:hypothetical protein